MHMRRGNKPEVKSSKPPQPDNKKKQEDAGKANLVLQMQRTFGNKAVLQMLLNERNNPNLLTREQLKLDALDKYPPATHAMLLPAYSILSLQVEAYVKILSAYNDYGMRCSQGGATGFFWRYHPGFRETLIKLIRGVFLPNIRDFMQLTEETSTDNPDADQERQKAAEELNQQFTERANGQDLDELEKRVVKPEPSAINGPGAALEKELASGPMYSINDKDFFNGFLEKNGMNYAVFEMVVKTAQAWELEESSTAEDIQDRLKQWRAEQNKLVAG
jgi:hypothetical protein